MDITGKLRITINESRVDGTLLARCGEDDPLVSATLFVTDLGFDDEDDVTVSGTEGEVSGVEVLCVTSIQSA